MGKLSKAQQAAETRQYQEARRREAIERQKRQSRLLWQIIIASIAVILVIVAVPIAIASLTKPRVAPKMSELDMTAVTMEQCTKTAEVTDHVLLNITYTDKNGVEQTGDVIIRLYANVAPKTVANFQSLVKSKFYDGLTFHRVVSGFMIQGGDPQGTGNGSSTAIKGEMTNNGFENNLSHVRGVVSMARRGDSYDSGSCQFFIMHQNYTDLDKEYASFGYVVYGMNTVDGIAATEVVLPEGGDEASSPKNPVVINYATFVKVAK